MPRSRQLLTTALAAVTAAALLVGLGGTAQPTAAAAAASTAGSETVTSAWTENSSVNIFKDALPTHDSSHSISVTMARNEYEAAQVAIRKDRAFTIQKVAFSTLASGKNTLAAANLKYQFVEYENLNHNSSFIGQYPINNPIRPAPGAFPDALSNDPTVAVPANTTQPIWIRAYAPKNTPAGVYKGTATVVTNAGQTAVPISVDVRDATVPDSKDSDFTTAMWMTFFGPLSWDDSAGDPVKQFYGFDRYTPKYWALMKNIATMMKQYRNNDLPVPLVSTLLDGGSSLGPDGKYQFNWQRFDQVVQFFIDQGAVKQIEGFWWAFGAKDRIFQTEIVDRDAAGKPKRSYVDSDGPAAKNFTAQFVPALRDHVRAKGWASIYWMHVDDEIDDSMTARYNTTAQQLHTVWPELRISDATNQQGPQAAVAAQRSFLIAGEEILNNNIPYYDKQRADGQPVWLYNANVPVGMYLNRFIDQPAVDQRLSMYFAFEHGVTGYLHWALNNWQYTMDQQDVKGDGWIVGPDKKNNTVKATIRFESLRDGGEDAELLRQIAKTKPALANGLAQSLVTNATRYSRDTAYVTRIHNAIVAAASGDPVFDTDLAKGATVTGPSDSVIKQVDLRKQAQIDGLRLTWGATFPKSFHVQLSYTGDKWADGYATTTGAGGDTFIGINGKARYLRIVSDSCPDAGCSINDLQIGGFPLAQQNLAGGKPYAKSEAPTHPDAQDAESTDGVLAGQFDDGRSWGYDVPSGTKVVSATVDLQEKKPVGEIRIHRYEDYEQRYSPDSVTVFTSVDGKTFVPKGTGKKTEDFTFPATEARYVKVRYTKTSGPNADALFIDEIEAYAPPADQTANFGLDAAYTKSAEPDDPTFPDTGNAESTDGVIAGDFFDGHGYAYYMTPGKSRTVSITLDLKGPKTLNRVQVAGYDDGVHKYSPDSVKVFTSTDGVAYKYQGKAAWPTGHWFDIPFADTFSTYVRLELTKKDGYFADYMFLDELAVFGDPNSATTNIALGKTYTKSDGGDPGYTDVTGKDSTDGFIAGGYPDHKSYAYVMKDGETRTIDVTVDLGASHTLSLVRFWRYNDGVHHYEPTVVKVLTSADGKTYTLQRTITTPTDRWFISDLPQVSARYVRFEATKTYGYFAEYIFVDELEIYGK